MPKQISHNGKPKNPTDKRKRCIYLPYDILEQMEKEAEKNNQGLSWMIQQAWIIAQPKLAQIPGSDKL